MADGVYADTSEVDRLARDLGDIPDIAGPLVVKALEVTSINIKKDWQEPLKGSATLPALPYAITYDIGGNVSLLRNAIGGGGTNIVVSEIGFDKGRNQGPLGNVSEFGTPTITGRGYGIRALQKNEDDFERGLDIALEQAERKAGL
jgi:hypothetical protein